MLVLSLAESFKLEFAESSSNETTCVSARLSLFSSIRGLVSTMNDNGTRSLPNLVIPACPLVPYHLSVFVRVSRRDVALRLLFLPHDLDLERLVLLLLPVVLLLPVLAGEFDFSTRGVTAAMCRMNTASSCSAILLQFISCRLRLQALYCYCDLK